MIPGYPGADPVGGLTGGVLIGLAGALMLLGGGRIAGVSGIAARTLGLAGGSLPRAGGAMFLLGLPLGALLVAALSGKGAGIDYPSLPALVVAGLLVGLGTRLGSGCTSGHGVCGVSRLSRRSLVATAVFMAAGIATVAAMTALGAAR